MPNSTLTTFADQPYLTETFNQIVNEVENSVTEVHNYNENVTEIDGTDKFTSDDLDQLDRKVAYMNSPEALLDFKAILRSKLAHTEDGALQKYMDVIAYLDSPEYKVIAELESEAFFELAQEVNATQSLKPITL